MKASLPTTQRAPFHACSECGAVTFAGESGERHAPFCPRHRHATCPDCAAERNPILRATLERLTQ